jgi:hypothetical protein
VISNGDARLHYLDSGGDDQGAPIVFITGMTDVAGVRKSAAALVRDHVERADRGHH